LCAQYQTKAAPLVQNVSERTVPPITQKQGNPQTKISFLCPLFNYSKTTDVE
jgi:hypothetical protein